MTPPWLDILWAQSATRTEFEWVRLRTLTEWWQLMGLSLVVLLLVAWVTWLYRRDTTELPRGVRWALLVLRVAAYAGLLAFFLNLELRTERSLIKTSRLALLVDTSQSMSVDDVQDPSSGDLVSRTAYLAQLLTTRPTLQELRKRHDVVVYTFDQTNAPTELTTLPRTTASERTGDSLTSDDQLQAARLVQLMLRIALACAVVALLALAIHFGTRWGRGREGESWSLLVAVVMIVTGLVVAGVSQVRYPELAGWWELGWQPVEPTAVAERWSRAGSQSSTDLASNDGASNEGAAASGAASSAAATSPGGLNPVGQPADAATAGTDPQQAIVWADALQPRGGATRLGDALQWTIDRERGGPLAGIVLISDGRENAGVDWQVAQQLARDAEIPIYTLGVGSETLPANVRVVDLEAPKRAYPRDKFTITAYVQGAGWQNKTLDLQLVSAAGKANPSSAPGSSTPNGTAPNAATPNGPTPPTTTPAEGTSPDANRLPGATEPQVVEDKRQVQMGADGELIPVTFQVSSETLGPRVYRVELLPSQDDLHAYDNQKDAQVQITENKTRVLLIAGGPNREYQFVRNLLFRDDDITLDVWLQTATSGTSQESDQLLDGFPTEPTKMFEYDCVIAFDPDWGKLSADQIDMLERWVGEKAGGLILVAGKLALPRWAESRQVDTKFQDLQALYPVVFYRSGLGGIQLGRDEADTQWPLKITEDGRAAPFLSLSDDPATGLNVWNEFRGVFGYYGVREVKPGARVLATFSDPQAAQGETFPPYIVSQLYGAGRVVFLGSAEMWRLRELSDAYFELFYTKLVRYCSEGRLLLDSSRGTLLAGQERYQLGDTVVLQANLSDEQFDPLEMADVPATVISPTNRRQTLVFRPLQGGARAGSYSAQFTAAEEGDYRVEIVLPGSELEVLSRTVPVRIPQLEIESPQRNTAALAQLAAQTGGTYYPDLNLALAATAAEGLNAAVPNRDQESFLPATSDQQFQQLWRTWLLAFLCTALFLEWLIRRLYRLA